MKRLGACALVCCLAMLQGCFDRDSNETKNNTDGAKSSVQMQDQQKEGSK